MLHNLNNLIFVCISLPYFSIILFLIFFFPFLLPFFYFIVDPSLIFLYGLQDLSILLQAIFRTSRSTTLLLHSCEYWKLCILLHTNNNPLKYLCHTVPGFWGVDHSFISISLISGSCLSVPLFLLLLAFILAECRIHKYSCSENFHTLLKNETYFCACKTTWIT
jgi:hypothetical protein